MPADPAERAEVLRIERWFDDDVTPRVRRAVLDALLRSPGYFARVFGDGAPAWSQRLYALTVPLAAPLVRRGNGITDQASVDDGLLAMRDGLEFVAARGAATGHLVGDRLTLADVVAASSLAMLVRPPDSPMACVEPAAPSFRALVARFADHPGAAWVRDVYARHRVARADFDGPSHGAARPPAP